MKFIKFFKCDVFLGIVLLLLICVSPFQSFAQEEAQQTASSDSGVSVAFQVELKLEGDKPESTGSFNFILEPEEENYPLPKNAEVTIKGEGSAYFGDITFTQSGDYVYYIRQKMDEPLANYKYDDRVYVVRVNVSPENSVSSYRVGTHSLQATFSVNQEGEAEKSGNVVFSNTYVDPTPTDTPVDNPATIPTETPVDSTTTTPTETPVDSITTTPTETPVDSTTTAPTETPVDSTTTTPTENTTPEVTITPEATTTPEATITPVVTTTPGSSGRSTPRTGDNTNVVILWVMLLCAAVGMSISVWLRIRTGKHSSK
jgi:pilin isopeptide linkage protein